MSIRITNHENNIYAEHKEEMYAAHKEEIGNQKESTFVSLAQTNISQQNSTNNEAVGGRKKKWTYSSSSRHPNYIPQENPRHGTPQIGLQRQHRPNSALKTPHTLRQNGNVVHYLEPAARAGNPEAQYHLAKCYHYGRGIAEDKPKAIEYYNAAARQNHAGAQAALGCACYDQQLYTTAVDYLEPAAQAGNPEAQYHLAKCYYYGRGVAEDKPKAIEYYNAAARQNHAGAQAALGCACYDQQLYTTAVDYLEPAAQAGNPEAQYRLAKCYHYGRGVAEDKPKAIKYYNAAARQNHAGAQAGLGCVYHDQQLYPEAVHYFTKAKEAGDLDALYYLAMYYHRGYGVTENRVTASKYYHRAAERGHAEAQNYLGVAHYGHHDFERAVQYFQSAANQGNSKAQFSLATCYEHGHGVAANLQTAVKYYKLAAQQNNANAQINLGLCYVYGEGVEKNDAEAFKHFQHAASLKHPQAQYTLGRYYYDGRGGLEIKGVKKDNKKAKEYFTLAAGQGHNEARMMLTMLQQL